MFHPAEYENTRPDGFSVLEVVPDPERKDGPRRFVPLKRTELTGEIAGPLADLRLIQTFGYSAEECDQTLEAVYRFPLPGDAAVQGVTVRFGEVEIRAELKKRQQAEADYEEAKRQGRQAALTTRESPDVFTLQVAGIQPDQEVVVETRYMQLARYEGADWTLRIPLTTSPRYVRSDERGSRYAQGQPLALLRDPGHRFALDLLLPEAGAVTSSTHALAVTEEEGGLRVRLQEGEVLPDRDCVLAWRPKQETQHPALHVLLHDDKASGQVYFLALVAPPAAPESGETMPREVVLLVDHSGSMEGAKWEAADWAVKRFLSDLTERDTFALGLFHDTTRWFVRRPQPADPGTIAAAEKFLTVHRDSGGTELGVALEQALHLPKTPGEYARHALIVTDAEVTDSGRILRLAAEEAKRDDRRRISVLCIDAAPNALLANELAEQGGGVAKFLTSSPEEDDITTALDAVLEDWAAPLLIGLRLEVNRSGAQTVGRGVLGGKPGGSAIDLGDLPAGRAVWVAGRVPHGDGPDLSFQVTTADGKKVAACRRDLNAPDALRPALKALFGARRVRGLEYLIASGYTGKQLEAELRRLGYDPQAVLEGKAETSLKVYAENTREDANHLLRQLLVQESLDYGLVSSETAFLAVRTEAGKPVEGTVAVANALPAGWSDRFTGFYSGSPHVLLCAAPMAGPSAGQQPLFGKMAAPMSAAYDMAAGASPDVQAESADAGIFESLSGAPPQAAPARGLGRFFARRAASASAAPSTSAAMPAVQPLYSGVPTFTGSKAILFDSAQEAGKLPEETILTRLEVRFPGGMPDQARLDPGLALLIFVDDLTSPRARVRLADLVRQGGVRPLNLRRQQGQVVRIVLADPAGAWAQNAPPLEVALAW
ncbi:MAG TPA: VIT and VWA domain-containing protein [Chthonomonadaceae bacterium]|nr:VIT and VWA domain-containing protein [Chthonomonadaceae bacterium]